MTKISKKDLTLVCIFDTIIKNIDAPKCDIDGTMQMLVSNIDYDEYLGRIAVGRVERGTITNGTNVTKSLKGLTPVFKTTHPAKGLYTKYPYLLRNRKIR